MDDFITGPSDFNIYFNSTDPRVIAGVDGWEFPLNKPLEFSADWEVAVVQIILKPPFSSAKSIRLSSPDNPDDKSFSKILNLDFGEIADTPQKFIKSLNNAIPENLRNELSVILDDDGVAVLNVSNTRLKFDSGYLTHVLGFKPETVYPTLYPTKPHQIRGNHKLKLISSCPIFCISVDFITPEVYGTSNSQIICIDIFPNTMNYKSYKYEENMSIYHKILRNYLSVLNLKISDIHGNIIRISDPVIVKFHFRKSVLL